MKVYAVKGHRFTGTPSGERWYREHDFIAMERYAEDLAVFHGEFVEVQHLNVEPNLPGCLPRLVTRISRLDQYFIDDKSQCLTRKTCNIF